MREQIVAGGGEQVPWEPGLPGAPRPSKDKAREALGRSNRLRLEVAVDMAHALLF